jgi:hypothetical protein
MPMQLKSQTTARRAARGPRAGGEALISRRLPRRRPPTPPGEMLLEEFLWHAMQGRNAAVIAALEPIQRIAAGR